MTLNLENETDISLGDVDFSGVAEKVIAAAADFEGCPYEIEVNLLLTDNAGIRILNREYRQIDRETDVLSFPMIDYDSPADFSALGEDVAEYFDPDTGELVLGDIIISLEKVIEQAEKYGHSTEREYAFLIAHSMLHLFGYDHMEPSEAEIMEKKQAAILEQLGISR